MKLILSRKGFDSSFGECPSPIFEDGSFLSLPIPEPDSPVHFADIAGPHKIGQLVEDLSPRVKASHGAHLDPDLRKDFRRRKRGWRPMFGQAEAAQRHLHKQGIDRGDIFLFFGWFRRVEQRGGRFHFQPGAPDLHMLFGWLKIGDIWRVSADKDLHIPDWAKDHPHVTSLYRENTIYVADRTDSGYAGGTFRSAVNELILTREDHTRSRWRLPRWFYPSEGKSKLSYHSNPGRWKLGENHAHLQSVGRGQEFVLDTRDYPEAVDWAEGLIAQNAS